MTQGPEAQPGLNGRPIHRGKLEGSAKESESNHMRPDGDATGPLRGIRVLELGSFIAGPFASQQLGDMGAEVIKVEPPGIGDPMRHWRNRDDRGDLWWPSLGRNKRSVAIDLRQPTGADLIRRMVPLCDVLIENFTPGTLERWGIGPDDLLTINERLVIVRVSGYGQDGPYAQRPGFGSLGEAIGGLRHLTGWPDRPSARVGISLGDEITSLVAAVGALAALREAERVGQGQVVDVSIYEAVFSLMESVVADYELAGIVRDRHGSTLEGVAPSNVYVTADGDEVLIAANSDPIFRRLVEALALPDLLQDARFTTHTLRGLHMEVLDESISARVGQIGTRQLAELLEEAEVPYGQVYTAREIIGDPHYKHRRTIQRHYVQGLGHVAMSAPVPRFSRTPGSVRQTAPKLGQDTRNVLAALCGATEDELEQLARQGVIEIPDGGAGTMMSSGTTSYRAGQASHTW